MTFTPANSAQDESAVLSSKILPSGFGYIRLTVLADLNNMQEYPDDIRVNFLNILDGFNQAHVPGVVLDIRGNHGGFDTLAAGLCGAFANAPSFYEITEFFDKRTNNFLRFTLDDQIGELVDTLAITPQTTRFLGPVVALVNPLTISSGEGLARCVNQLNRGGVVGFYGTRGSFGEAGGLITLPDNLVIHYPYGRSVDANGVVQIDSRQGVGGVVPKYRVPRTFTTVMSYASGQDVELQYAVDTLTQLANQH
jgi:carboxyl-terminal processing protease